MHCAELIQVGMTPGFRVFRTRDNTGPISTEISLTPGVAINDADQGYNFELIRENDNRLRANFFGSEMSLVVNVHPYNGRNYLNYEVYAPKSSSPLGLLGNLDNNREVEFFRRGETQHIAYPVNQRPDRFVFDGLKTCEVLYCNDDNTISFSI